MRKDNTIEAFFALVRGGLWEQDVKLQSYRGLDFNEVMRLAESQAVVGLVTAGLEHVIEMKIPKEIVLQFIGQTLQLEQRNAAMNSFIGETIEKLREADIYTLLVKGQGVAQCYERPMWRTSGDVDFFLSGDNYVRAKSFFYPLSSGCKPERKYSKEWGLNISSWYVELHGTLRTGLSTRVDKAIDEVQRCVFYEGKARSWMNGKTQMFLPAADEDVFFVFTHFIKHFYKEGGVSLRQLCDWCRLLWTYRGSVDEVQLEKRLKRSGLMSEWKAFAAVAGEYLGMLCEAIPLFNENDNQNEKLKRKADKILAFILKGGEWQSVQDTITVGRIFPLNTIRFAPGILLSVNWLKIKERLFSNNE